jgi:mannose-6-phosphate isomerase-like protein (cupin superfamily)
MGTTIQSQYNFPPALLMSADDDRFGEQRSLGISSITFKVVPQDSNGTFIIENSFREKGGPARHLHYDQDEWFYALEGEFAFEVGTEKFKLKPGDSLFGPRKVSHGWAFTGGAPRGRILIAFLPAGKMESFFREVTKANAMPPQDPKLWQAHGMELLGPPLAVD